MKILPFQTRAARERFKEGMARWIAFMREAHKHNASLAQRERREGTVGLTPEQRVAEERKARREAYDQRTLTAEPIHQTLPDTDEARMRAVLERIAATKPMDPND